MTAFQAMAQSGSGAETDQKNAAPGPFVSENRGEEKIYRIRFKPPQEIFLTGADPVLLLKELRQLSECRVVAHLNEIPPFEDIDAERCYTCWDIILTIRKGINAIKDVFIFVEDDSELRIDVIDENGSRYAEPACKKLGEILVERGDLTPEDMAKFLESRKRFGEVLVEQGLAGPSQVEAIFMVYRAPQYWATAPWR